MAVARVGRMTVVLVGGGPDTVTDPSVVAPFVAALTRCGERPRVAYVLFDHQGSAEAFLPEYVRPSVGWSRVAAPTWGSPPAR